MVVGRPDLPCRWLSSSPAKPKCR